MSTSKYKPKSRTGYIPNQELSERKRVTKVLTDCAERHFCKLKYSTHTEIGIERYGRQRADVLALNLRGDVVIVEVKSCRHDFESDKKWLNYLPKCNRMYFCISEQYWKSTGSEGLKQAAREHGCGVLVLDNKSGFLRTRIRSCSRSIDDQQLLKLALKMVWRYGRNASNTRRIRKYL